MIENNITGYPSIDRPWVKYYLEEAIDTPLPKCTIYEYLWNNNKEHLNDVALIYIRENDEYATIILQIIVNFEDTK